MFSFMMAARTGDNEIWCSLDDDRNWDGRFYIPGNEEIRQRAGWYTESDFELAIVQPKHPDLEVDLTAIEAWEFRGIGGYQQTLPPPIREAMFNEIWLHLVTNTTAQQFNGNNWWILGADAYVMDVSNSLIVGMHRNARIECLSGSSRVWVAAGESHIATATQSSIIHLARESARIGVLRDFATIYSMRGNAMVGEMLGYSRIGRMDGTSRVLRMRSPHTAVGSVMVGNAHVGGQTPQVFEDAIVLPPPAAPTVPDIAQLLTDAVIRDSPWLATPGPPPAEPAPNRRILRLPAPPLPTPSPPLTAEVFGEGICPCCERPVQDLERRRRNTRYPEEADESNWLVSCDECYAHDAEELEYQWQEYYRGRL